MSGVWLEFKRPERLVATEKFDQPWYPGDTVGTIALAESDGVTELPQIIRYESPKARESSWLRRLSMVWRPVKTGWRRSGSHVETQDRR